MARYFSLLLAAVLVAVTISNVCAQTFQYSRGWTNGKRSDPALELRQAVQDAVQHEIPVVLLAKRRVIQQSLEDLLRNPGQ